MFDYENDSSIKAEERVYNSWEKEEKNRILRMSNVQRKQSEWSKLFPPLPEFNEDLVF